jgi:hypothetical protein
MDGTAIYSTDESDDALLDGDDSDGDHPEFAVDRVLERAQLAAGDGGVEALLKALDAEQLDCISAQAYSRVPALKALIKEWEADKENAAPVTPTLLCPVLRRRRTQPKTKGLSRGCREGSSGLPQVRLPI